MITVSYVCRAALVCLLKHAAQPQHEKKTSYSMPPASAYAVIAIRLKINSVP